VAIVSDVLHSRVARSLIGLGASAPSPRNRAQDTLPTAVRTLGVQVHHDMHAGLQGCDVVVMLRLQSERMRGALLPSAGEYSPR
jgi:aspartate carbamoyltransferase catalytic subunit